MKSAQVITEHHESMAAMEAPARPDGVTTDRRAEAMGRDVEELPSGYFYSARFIGSYCVSGIHYEKDWGKLGVDGMQAIGLAFACGTGGFALVAPILTQINNSFGKLGSYAHLVETTC